MYKNMLLAVILIVSTLTCKVKAFEEISLETNEIVFEEAGHLIIDIKASETCIESPQIIANAIVKASESFGIEAANIIARALIEAAKIRAEAMVKSSEFFVFGSAKIAAEEKKAVYKEVIGGMETLKPYLWTLCLLHIFSTITSRLTS